MREVSNRGSVSFRMIQARTCIVGSSLIPGAAYEAHSLVDQQQKLTATKVGFFNKNGRRREL